MPVCMHLQRIWTTLRQTDAKKIIQGLQILYSALYAYQTEYKNEWRPKLIKYADTWEKSIYHICK